MRISWLRKEIIDLTRQVLLRNEASWRRQFEPSFHPPPPPKELTADEWNRIAEHVARAERVGLIVREHGFAHAHSEFAASAHAVEVATLISAALQIDRLDLELVEHLLTSCPIDEYVVYGSFLTLLVQNATADTASRVVRDYELFVIAAQNLHYRDPSWPERVRVARDGLADLYVRVSRHEDAENLFALRHREDTDDVAVALSASRAFLSAGELARTIHWLNQAATRAESLGRDTLGERLRAKVDSVRARMN